MDTLASDRQAAIRDCLQKILDSREFASSERLSAFLRYIVTETLEGRADRLKGYTIALSVFGCNEEFDPQSNSIVRVEASRLRKRLSDYYADLGANDPFEIRVNRGAYSPQFIERPPFAAMQLAALSPNPAQPVLHRETTTLSSRDLGDAPPPSTVAYPPRILGRALWAGLTAAIALIAVIATYATLQPGQRPATSAAATDELIAFANIPSISVSPFNVEPELGASAAAVQSFGRELISVLGRFDFVRVQDPLASSGGQAPEYRLDGDFGRRGEKMTVSFRLAHRPSQQILWSRIYQFDGPSFDDASWDRISSSVATVLMRNGGVVHSDRFRRMPAVSGALQGFACFANGSRLMQSANPADYAIARDCLERMLKDDPKEYRAHSMLAMLLVSGYVKGFAEYRDMIASALENSAQAVALAPQSGYAHLAYYATRFADRRYDDAFDSAAKAMALNPYSVEIKGRVAVGYVIRGDAAKAKPLLTEISSTVDNGPPWLDIYMAVSAYLEDDIATATRIVARTRVARSPTGILMRIIVAQANNDQEMAARYRAALTTEFPGFARDIPASLEKLGFLPEIQSKLLSGLKQSSLQPVDRTATR